MTAPLEAGSKPLSVEAIRRRVEPPGSHVVGLDRDGAPGRRPGHVVTVYSPKGGAGCSTLAVNLAIVLRRRTGRETILMDAALHRGELDLFLNLPPRQGLSEVLQGVPLESALAVHPTGVQLLAGSECTTEPDHEALSALIRRLGARHGAWIVVDTSPALPTASEAALAQADRIVVPIFLDVAHLRRLKRDLARTEALRGAEEKLVFVAWNERTDVSPEAAARILGAPIQAELPFEPLAARRAINRGFPMVESEPGGQFARALARLSDGLAEPDIRALVPTGGQGPLSRILDWLKAGGTAATFGS